MALALELDVVFPAKYQPHMTGSDVVAGELDVAFERGAKVDRPSSRGLVPARGKPGLGDDEVHCHHSR